MFTYFIGAIFFSVVFFIVALSILLIYSLMISDVDSKTYEMGILRALGLRQRSLVLLISMQAFVISVPGLVIALTVGVCLNIIVAFVIYTYSFAEIKYLIAQTPVLWGIFLGIFIPYFSNILPIRRALSRTISDSINIFRKSVSDVTVRIIKLESAGISIN